MQFIQGQLHHVLLDIGVAWVMQPDIVAFFQLIGSRLQTGNVQFTLKLYKLCLLELISVIRVVCSNKASVA